MTEYANKGFVIGVDLGRRQDHTAIVVVQKLVPIAPEMDDPSTWRYEYRTPTAETIFRVRQVGRLPLGVNYETAARDIAKTVHRVNCLDYDHSPRLFLDSTGIGDPIIDSLQKFLPTGVSAVRVLWTSGAKFTRHPGHELHVGKGWCVSRLQSLVDTGRIQVPDDPQSKVLLDELMSFEVKITESGTVMAGAKGGAHDDLVMSLALCILEDSAPQVKYSGPALSPAGPTWDVNADWQDLHSTKDLFG